MSRLRFLLRFIGVVQLFFGVLFTVAPARAGALLGLEPSATSDWVQWLFLMMGARFLGYGVGMLVAARDPMRHQSWINTMIGIQVIDWAGTVGYLLAGDLPVIRVASALILPVVFVAGLLWWHPRRLAAESADRAGATASVG
jgi:hypothetical protein